MKILTLIISMAVALQVNAEKFDVDAQVARMMGDGKVISVGNCDDTGYWVLSLGSSPLDGKKKEFARVKAELAAKKILSGFISQEVAAVQEYKSTEVDGEITESFSSWARACTSESLKGIAIEKSFIKDDVFYVAALFVQHAEDVRAVMAVAKAHESPGIVTAIGEGVTREAAVSKACKQALEQAFTSTILASDTMIDENVRQRAYSDVQGVISSYRIVEESHEGDVYRVKIVAEISKDDLLDSYGAQMKSMGDPVFQLICANGGLKTAIADWMTSHGIKVNETTHGADYKFEVKSIFRKIIHPATGRGGVELSLSLDCYDKAGNKFFSLKNDPRKSNSFIRDTERQIQICADKAMNQIDRSLHEHIQRAISNAVNNGRQVRLVFRNVRAKKQSEYVQHLVSVINNSDIASAADYAFREDVAVATIRCNVKGNFNDFIDSLKLMGCNLPSPLQVTSNKAVFEF